MPTAVDLEWADSRIPELGSRANIPKDHQNQQARTLVSAPMWKSQGKNEISMANIAI
jgi:hypothetical protein